MLMRLFVENYGIRLFTLTGPDHNLNELGSRVSDLHWFNADPDTDPDPEFFLIADPDPGSRIRISDPGSRIPDPDLGSGSRVWWPKIEKNF